MSSKNCVSWDKGHMVSATSSIIKEVMSYACSNKSKSLECLKSSSNKSSNKPEYYLF